MITLEQLARGATLAEVQGVTQELGRAVASVAGEEAAAGHLDTAREILEGLAVTNPHDAATWAMLAVVDRRRGKLLSARVCAETAYRLAPLDRHVRLVRAEVLLCLPDHRARAAFELRRLCDGERDEVAERSRALLTALGEPRGS
jgi:predicted Zn-dependent protease